MTRIFRTSLLLLPLLLASIVPPPVQAIEMQESAISGRMQSDDFDRGFSSGFELFYAGPEWFLNALSNPRSRNPFVRSFMYDSAGDRLGAENGYVGTLRDIFDVNLFGNIVTFVGATGGKTSTPTLVMLTIPKKWDGGTSGTGTIWSTASNWANNIVPVATDDVIFDNSSITGGGTIAPLIGLNAAQVANSISFGSSTGTALGAFALQANSSGTTARTLTLGTSGQADAGSIIVDASVTGTQSLGTANGVMTITLATGVTGFTVTNNSSSQTLTLAAKLAEGATAGSTLTVSSAGGLVQLGGANTYTGKTSILSGTISVSLINKVTGGTASSNLGAPTTVASGTIDFGSGASSAQLTYTGTGETTDRVINLAGTTGGATIDQSGASGSLTFTSALTATGAGSKTLTLQGSNAGTGEISGAIVDNLTGTNNTSVSKSGTGTWTLSGNNTYSGGTTVSDGLLQLKSSSALGSSSGSLTVNGGILDLNGQNISVGNLTGSGGTIWNNGPNAGSSTVTLTIGTTNTGGGTYAGVITDNNGAAPLAKVALTKTGTGTITLSGANTYTGATTVNGGGTLFINGDQSAATGATTVTGAGTVLGGTGTIGGNVTVGGSNAATIIEGGTGSTGQTLTVRGSLTMQSGSIIELALGASAAHSTLALTAAGPTSFYLTQQFTFIDLGAQTATLYSGIITGVTTPVTTAGWTIDNPGWSGAFVWNPTTDAIDLTLTAIPEPSTWIGGALALAAIGLMSRKRFAKRLRVIS